jgi:predicted RNA binding protein YcfA (HicA-like mRNA interferase family)
VKYRQLIEILEAHGFSEKRCSGSHHQYEGYVDGVRQVVTVAYRQPGEDIKPMNLASMIRQSKLPRKLFR